MAVFGGAAKSGDPTGSACNGSPTAGFHDPRSCTRTLSNASTPGPEARAECGSSARSDPRGGQPEPDTGRGLSLPQSVVQNCEARATRRSLGGAMLQALPLSERLYRKCVASNPGVTI